MKKILAGILGVIALVLVFLAIWYSADWYWLKFGLSSAVVACVAIVLAASDDNEKRP